MAVIEELKMAKGGGSAGLVLALGLLILVASQCFYVEGAVYHVGGVQGWGPFDYQQWLVKVPKMKAGDRLVFNYNPSQHDVTVVGYKGYKSCKVTGRPKQFRSGKDQISLKKGWNYFICSTRGHCFQGMRLAVKAL